MTMKNESTLNSVTTYVNRKLTVIPGSKTVYFGIKGEANEFLNINVDLEQLVAAINKAEGVEATYAAPKVKREVPKGIGAQITLDGEIILTRVNSDTEDSWVQNSGSIATWYGDSGIDYYLNHTLTYDTKIISKGVES